MFPDYKIHAITNGVHAATWLSKPMQELLRSRDSQPGAATIAYFRSVYGIAPGRSPPAIARQARLFEVVAERLPRTVRQRRQPARSFNPTVLTLGFARRVATYKRASLLFTDPERLVRSPKPSAACRSSSPARPTPPTSPARGSSATSSSQPPSLNSASLKIVYLENYDWELGALLTQGVDVWVNTPRRPYEASGTSGMKAALNGVPSLSVLDGWWIEGCAEGVTGWAIEDGIPRPPRPPASTTSSSTPSPHSSPSPPPGRRCSSTASPSTAASSTPTACCTNM